MKIRMKDIFVWLVILTIIVASIAASVLCFTLIFKSDFESDINFLLGFIGVAAPVLPLLFTLDILTTPTEDY